MGDSMSSPLSNFSRKMFVGVDGCKAGWFTVLLTENNEWEINVFPDVDSIWNKHSAAAIILIDIPIGLREKGYEERECDRAARKKLDNRASSVFPPPSRQAVYSKDYGEACRINKQITGRSLSRQTWNIAPKIKEVDIFLSKNRSARVRVRETHPEICFWALAGHPMKHPKKTPEGISERRSVLKSACPCTEEIMESALSGYRRKQVKRDDILDALSIAVTAKLGVERGFLSVVETPEYDQHGLCMEIVFAKYNRLRKV